MPQGLATCVPTLRKSGIPGGEPPIKPVPEPPGFERNSILFEKNNEIAEKRAKTPDFRASGGRGKSYIPVFEGGRPTFR